MIELVNRNPGLDQSFRRIDANCFTAAVYQNGQKVCKGSVSLSGSRSGWARQNIEYVMTDDPHTGSMNEAVCVEADDQSMYFKVFGLNMFGEKEEKLSPQGAADVFWGIFIRPLQER